MKRRITLLLCAVLLLAALLSGCGAYKIDLADFEESGVYQFKDLAWETDVETVRKALGVKFEEPVIDSDLSTGFHLTTYAVEKAAVYDSKKAWMEVEFIDGGLSQIIFNFKDLAEECDVFYSKLQEELISIYGEASSFAESEVGGIKVKRHGWEKPESRSFITLAGNGTDVMVGVTWSGYLPQTYTIDFNDYKTDGLYQFKNLTWRSDVETVKTVLGIDLGTPYMDQDIRDGEHHQTAYAVVDAGVFDGKKAGLEVSFIDESISDLTYRFKDLNEAESDGLLVKLVESAKSVHGEPDEVTENSYKWNSEKDGVQSRIVISKVNTIVFATVQRTNYDE